MEVRTKIDNSFYDNYGDKWYTAYDDPVALLRAENQVKTSWILTQLELITTQKLKILDVGCGAGFLSNELAKHHHVVTGVDLSAESLRVAKCHDVTGSVQYQRADAFHLPYQDGSYDALMAMDFLEHVERPDLVIKECARVLSPGGLFFFHTLNRNIFSYFVAIKLLEWFIKNTPKNMHVIELFIKPFELEGYCKDAGLRVMKMTGIRPLISSIDWKMIRTGIVSSKMKFTLTKSTLLSYMGVSIKDGAQWAPFH